VSRDDVIEEARAVAWGPGWGLDAEEVSFQFSKGSGLQLVSELCDLCGNREVGSVRRICFDGRTVVLAGRREDVGVRDVATRRALYEHDTGSVDRRRPASVWLVEPVRDGLPVLAWCPGHGLLRVGAQEIADAIARFDSFATPRKVKPVIVRLGRRHVLRPELQRSLRM
jgi:hypothetical protein